MQGDVWEVYHDIASYLLQTTSENVVGNKRGRRSPRKTMVPSSAKSGIHRTSSQPLLPSSQPPQPKVPLTHGTRALSAGAVTRRLRTRGVAHRGLPHASAGLKEPGKCLVPYLDMVKGCHTQIVWAYIQQWWLLLCHFWCINSVDLSSTICTCTYMYPKPKGQPPHYLLRQT